jgi:hypothetical protein
VTVPRRLQLLAGGLWAASWFLPAAETSGDLLRRRGLEMVAGAAGLLIEARQMQRADRQ